MSDKLKCIKGETCIYCGSTYCRFVDELQAEKEKVEVLQQYKASKQASYEAMQRKWNQAEQEKREYKKRVKDLEEKVDAYKNDRFCQGGCAVYQYDKINRLKQVLKEIKGIAENNDLPPCLEVDCNCDNCYDEMTNQGENCMQRGLNLILQKCEVLDDE